ncbi:MAG: hypothetical protein IKG23_03130 [Clostridia bacterium]|nr:hypothetical protein [Clostridia bacterium]
MASGATVKMGVDVTQFKQGMQQAQQSAKTLNAQMKANENQFKATGDKEKYLTEKGKLLKEQLEAQKTAAANAEKALEAMRKNGVEKTNADYQKLEQSLAGAQAAMYDTQAAMNALSTSEGKAADGANSLTTNLNSINKKVSLDTVLSGIDRITGGLEKAAQKAVQVGQSIWDEIMNSAKWADDVQTMAAMWEVPVTRILQLDAMVATGMDTTTEAVLGSMQKMRKGIGTENKATMDALKSLGLVVTEYGGKTEQGFDRLVTEDQTELFFMAGKAIMEMGDEFDKEAAAMAIFGKSWRELLPLFSEYQDADSFNEALEGMNINSEEDVKKLADLNDQMSELEHNFEVLKNEVLAGLAPALTSAAEVLSNLLQQVQEYLQTPEGQKALQDMETAVSGLFSDLSKIDPEDVVNSLKTVFDQIVTSLTWLSEHKDDVVKALEVIGVAFGTIKIAELAGNVGKVVTGFRDLLNLGGGGGGGGNTPTIPSVPTTPRNPNAPTTGTGGGGNGGPLGWVKSIGTKAKDAGKAILSGAGAKWAALGGAYALVPAAVATVGIAPGVMLQNYVTEQIRLDQAEMEVAAERLESANSENAKFVRITAENSFLQKDENGNEKKNIIGMSYSQLTGATFESLMGLKDRSGAEMAKLCLALQGAVNPMTGNYAWTDLNRLWNGELEAGDVQELAVSIATALSKQSVQGLWDLRTNGIGEGRQLPAGWAYDQYGQPYRTYQTGDADLDRYAGSHIGSTAWGMMDERQYAAWLESENAKYIEVNGALETATGDLETAAQDMTGLPDKTAEAVRSALSGMTFGIGNILGGLFGSHANGLFSVPWDGYPAILHKGEQVLTAREARQYNSNIYFGNVNLNNGLEIEALTESIDRRNRRQRSGYGAA